MKIFLVGYPGDVGGANTEAWHTIKLWRKFGVEVNLIPTWEADPKWRARCDSIGCKTHDVKIDDIGSIPGLPGGIIVSMCNKNFLQTADRWHELGCRKVWVNCMTWTTNLEKIIARRDGHFDAYVFQSEYQKRLLLEDLSDYNIPDSACHLIRGAFDAHEFEYDPLPHEPDTPFIIGRISRAAPDKFNRDSWSTYERINYRPLRANLLGWDKKVEHKLGKPPCWATVLEQNSVPPAEFYKSIHCLFHITGGSRENWPRVGLEAMAAGVPIVAENSFGWPEMIDSGATGFLGKNRYEMAHHASTLANDEKLRLRIALNARMRLEEETANPNIIWAGWNKLFESLARKPVAA